MLSIATTLLMVIVATWESLSLRSAPKQALVERI
jgi:hypothetical protein